MAATDVYLIRKNQQWVKYSAVLDVTVADLVVQSSEFRDTFSSTASITPVGTTPVAGINPSSLSGPFAMSSVSLAFTDPTTIGLTTVDESDEVAHVALRQSPLNRTFWKFDYGAAATPRYAHAWILEGDIIANNPPETL